MDDIEKAIEYYRKHATKCKGELAEMAKIALQALEKQSVKPSKCEVVKEHPEWGKIRSCSCCGQKLEKGTKQ